MYRQIDIHTDGCIDRLTYIPMDV